LYFILAYQFPVFSSETRNTKHILESKPIGQKLFFLSNETKINSVKNPTKIQGSNRRRKSI